MTEPAGNNIKKKKKNHPGFHSCWFTPMTLGLPPARSRDSGTCVWHPPALVPGPVICLLWKGKRIPFELETKLSPRTCPGRALKGHAGPHRRTKGRHSPTAGTAFSDRSRLQGPAIFNPHQPSSLQTGKGSTGGGPRGVSRMQQEVKAGSAELGVPGAATCGLERSVSSI